MDNDVCPQHDIDTYIKGLLALRRGGAGIWGSSSLSSLCAASTEDTSTSPSSTTSPSAWRSTPSSSSSSPPATCSGPTNPCSNSSPSSRSFSCPSGRVNAAFRRSLYPLRAQIPPHCSVAAFQEWSWPSWSAAASFPTPFSSTGRKWAPARWRRVGRTSSSASKCSSRPSP